VEGLEGKHLVLASLEDGVRALSIRQLGGFAESIGLRTTLLFLIKTLGAFGRPVEWPPGEVEAIAGFLEREGVTHLGFYLMTGTYKPLRDLIAKLRAAGFKGMVLLGGIHVTLMPEESLVEGAQFAVQGPGEIPLRRILEGADPASVPGLVWRDAQGAVRVNPRTAEQALPMDDRPFPLWRLGRDRVLLKGRLRVLDAGLHKALATWHGGYYDLLTSIGCVYKCAYCCQTHRGPVLRASVDRVIREVLHVRECLPFLAGVNIQDDSFFSGSKEWVEEFCRRFKAEVGLPFIARMIPKFVTPERLDTMVQGGLVYVTMGLEASDRLNRTLFHRPETVANYLKAARAVLERGLILSIDLLADNPYETEEDLRQIARTLNALPRPNWWIVSLSLTPFPGTPLYERCEKDGMLGKFATDAYDAMLMPSREGGYRTPEFWHKLNTQLLPLIGPELGEKLIAAGPGDPSAAATVERLTKWLTRLHRLTNWMRDRLPTFYAVLFRVLRLGARGKPLPRIMGGGDS
jgi:anaerobic magnesium-protoporphyrin IX monomethyl ester cyclase